MMVLPTSQGVKVSRPAIGNRVHAIECLEAYRAGNQYSDPWEVKGSGSIRVALLHKPTDVIYKVEHNLAWAEFSNRVEAKNARRLAGMCYPDQWWSTRVRIPKVSLFKIEGRSVLAMEHIHGTHNQDR